MTLPPTITTMDNYTFAQCKVLTSVTLPPTTTSISNCTFNGYRSLTSIILPPITTTIGACAFFNSRSLTSVALSPTIHTIGDRSFAGCSSLMSVYLPEIFAAISITAFDRCSKLCTITASAFCTATLDKRDDGFKHLLVKAGFSLENHIYILYSLCPARPYKGTIHYEWKTIARTNGTDGQLPLFTAAGRSLKWHYMEIIFTTYMRVIQEIVALSGLPLFMLATARPASDIESIYKLWKEYPAAISVTSHTH